jgi:hypothetical protein
MPVTSFLERITNGNVEITSDQFPNFLYDVDEAEELTEENPDGWDAERGLLRSSLCLWVRCFVFLYIMKLLTRCTSPINVYLWATAFGSLATRRRNLQ